MQGYEPTYTIIDELSWPPKETEFIQVYSKVDARLVAALYGEFHPQEPQSRKFPADRTRSPRWRAGSRRNKKIKNVKPFFSDWWKS